MFEIGSSLREARIRQDLEVRRAGGADEGAGEVPPAPRGGAVRPAPGARLHEGLPAGLRGLARARRRLYVEEYNSRYVVGEEAARRASRAIPAGGPRRRRERRESGTVGVALAAILLVTALVIAAWRFGGHDDPQVEGINANTPRATGLVPRSTQQQVTLSVRASRGPSFMEVRVGTAAGRPLYTGTLEKGQAAAVHEEGAVPLRRAPRQRGGEGQRPRDDAAELAVGSRVKGPTAISG